MFQRLLISTDLTDALQRLRNFVPSLAAGGVKQVVFLHTVPVSSDREIPQIEAEKIAAARDHLSLEPASIPAGVEVQIEVQWGKPSDTILNTAKKYQSDLIVLGSPNRSLLSEKLMGSTTMKLCQQITTPVMILRPQLIGAFTDEELDLRCRHLFRSLLIPFDGTPTATYLIAQIKAAKLHTPDALQKAVLVWVTQENSRLLSTTPAAALSQLAAVKSDLEALQLQIQTEVRAGIPIQEVLSVAQQSDLSAIALSSSSLGKLIELTSPSFAGEILRRSWHPVIYFPPDK